MTNVNSRRVWYTKNKAVKDYLLFEGLNDIELDCVPLAEYKRHKTKSRASLKGEKLEVEAERAF